MGRIRRLLITFTIALLVSFFLWKWLGDDGEQAGVITANLNEAETFLTESTTLKEGESLQVEHLLKSEDSSLRVAAYTIRQSGQTSKQGVAVFESLDDHRMEFVKTTTTKEKTIFEQVMKSGKLYGIFLTSREDWEEAIIHIEGVGEFTFSRTNQPIQAELIELSEASEPQVYEIQFDR
ncbi:hypothetical protein N781_13815 [Pontibacillus halophilus JSM 076056 = DSM 19796]|uniref:Uncharacterized protein n=1 Tax=Pontibacillus halophilus JSM 076056 = DSM 19796 TaxID=1385510 RepID=A0A0A5GPI4_9BACI|nr:hypothetical protein [Pontibacillus halophilus]KGX93055.1 hypothetical protein N781_13815 [Pontibacillus halophilus JSM 076056 = DSM 19796]